MKKLTYLFLTLMVGVLIYSCGKEEDSTKIQGEVQIENRDASVWLCHKYDGNNPHEIYVDESSVDAHIAHGDVYLDADGDGFTAENTCEVGDQTDCDDTDPAVNPNVTEVPYDGIDNDCNPATLDDDLDEDGYPFATDCDDCDDTIYPGAEEVCDDNVDNNCDGQVDEDCNSCVNGTTELLSVEINPGLEPYTLFVHPTNNNSGVKVPWGGPYIDIIGLNNYTSLTGAEADFNGSYNTSTIVAQLGAGNYAANICDELIAFGCDDWYLPALGELKAMYEQIGPAGNNDFKSDAYWSSSEFFGSLAWEKRFADGFSNGQFKEQELYCRCVRK